MSIIECRGATRRYPRRGRDPVVAVDHVNLDVQPGEFLAVQGPSGSGKTTLLGLLAGLEAADDGVVRLLGHDLRSLSPTERARLRQRRVGIVFQSFGLLAAFSAGENVALPLGLAGVAVEDRAARAAAALEEVGLGSSFGARIDELSGGERQRVAVARALVIEPVVLLADEPTGNLDEGNGREVLALLAEAVRRRGTTLVLVTHDPLSASLADRRCWLRDGRLVTVAA